MRPCALPSDVARSRFLCRRRWMKGGKGPVRGRELQSDFPLYQPVEKRCLTDLLCYDELTVIDSSKEERGRRREERQQEIWVATRDLAQTPRHAFFQRLNRLLAEADFDRQVEDLCKAYYAEGGRPVMPPGQRGDFLPVCQQSGQSDVCDVCALLLENRVRETAIVIAGERRPVPVPVDPVYKLFEVLCGRPGPPVSQIDD